MRQWILGWDLFSLQVRQQILETAVMALCGMVIGMKHISSRTSC